MVKVVDQPLLVTEALAFAIFVCGVWTGLRMRLLRGSRGKVLRFELLVALLMPPALFGMCVGIPAALGKNDFLSHSTLGELGSYMLLLLAAPGFLMVRTASWLWMRWDRLRRTRFLWALTHAHLMVVMLVALVFLAGGLVRSTQINNPLFEQLPPALPGVIARVLIQVFPWIILTTALTLGGLALVLPPSMLFSFLVARRMTGRLESLAKATRLLRSGDLCARVEVSGEDEVAQLQSDFNAMAADLQLATQDLKAERDKVTLLLKAQRELTASVSHELRTPVATMRGYLDAVLQKSEKLSPENLQQDLEIVSREVDRLQTLIEDLFALSRAEIGSLSLRLGAVKLQELVPVIVSTLAPLVWNSGRVEALAEVPPNLPPVQADSGRLEQVLRNLLHNATRHTPPGGIVVITACLENVDEVRLDVSDTGEGIAAEDLPRIWEKFFQAGEGHKPTHGSAGIGLALVKELSEAMGGRVGVESRVGEGSTFHVWLKRAG
jgi:signal transduction histidine kinase